MPKPIIYLGPSMSTGRVLLTHGTIYINALPPNLTRECQNNPDLHWLFIDAADVGQARRDIAAGDSTFLGAVYQRVKIAYTNAKGA